jgi:two-component system chemotaxis response regulator CheY
MNIIPHCKPVCRMPLGKRWVRSRNRSGGVAMVAQLQGTKTILVVEDDDVAREGMVTILRREGFHVVSMPDGWQALDYLGDGGRPDLILLDMVLPILDGWDFLKEVQKCSEPLNIPIVITTGAYLTPEWAHANGCRGFVCKPIDLADLLAEIRKCLA